MKSNKILNFLITAIAIVGAFLFIRIFMADPEAIETDPAVQNSVISPMITFSTLLLYITIGTAVVLSLWSLIRNPQNLMKTLGGIGVLVVFFIIAYALSDANAVLDTQGVVLEGGEEGSTTNKLVGTGIIYSLILGGIASLFFVFDLVKGLVKS
jgi:hypothetical protein